MYIITKLKLAAWIPVYVALIIGGILFLSHRMLAETQKNGRTPQEIILRMYDLNDLAWTYVRYHEERPRQQFLAESDSLSRFITTLSFDKSDQQNALQQILVNLEGMEETFQKLIAAYERDYGVQDAAVYAEAEERLTSQILIRSREGVSSALHLKNLIDEEISVTQHGIYLFVIVLLAFTTLPLTIILLRMMKSIAESYATLRRGTEIVAEGNLDHTIGLTAQDEIGEFARAFDLMTHKLRETTVSKIELEQRVHARTGELQQRADQLARMASELTLAEQRERRRLAEILHDHLQQLLAGAKFRLDVLSRRMAADRNDAFDQVRGLLDEAIGASRSLTVELSPPILHEGGLAAGLEWLKRWMKEKHDLDVELQLDTQEVAEREDVRILLFQAVRELLFNVVKHARVNHARVELAIRNNEQFCIEVTDHGRGFNPEVAFVPRDMKGGFGLFSIRERLALLGGRLEIESAEGKGAIFRLTAPIHRVEPVSPEPVVPAAVETAEDASGVPPEKTGPAGREDMIRVLLADDHQVMREGLASLLLEEDDMAVVGEASDGLEALNLARDLRPDVVLMDFSMPKMDGVEATRQLHREMPHIRIIGLSMYEESDRSAAMMEAGASAYLTKSEKSNILLHTIRRVFPKPGIEIPG